jgi:hypothetical protein
VSNSARRIASEVAINRNALNDENVLADGTYITTPKWGRPTVKREIIIVDGVVTIMGHRFSQWEFFEVNVLAK